MKLLFLTLIMAQQAADAERHADEWLHTLYMRDDVKAVCLESPTEVITIELVNELFVTIRCRAWHNWWKLQNEQ